jgi:hypothetical protein
VHYSDEVTLFGSFQVFISEYPKSLPQYCPQLPKPRVGAIFAASSRDPSVENLHKQVDGNET